MNREIPIANLYHLLAYAWNHRLEEAELTNVDATFCPDLNNLFARILGNATRHLLRRGLDLNYVSFEAETSRVRGRIDFTASEKQRTRMRGKLVCQFDELSPDVLHNRIVKATLGLLLMDRKVAPDARIILRKVHAAFQGVADLRVSPCHFQRVQLHRNNRNYRFVLHLCELIHASLLPEKHANGSRRFRDFTRDEKLMARIFEDFVRNFAHRQFPSACVTAMHIRWAEIGGSAMLPLMKTDVTIAWPDRKLILDCKYYREALSSRYEVLRFHPGNLYQLNAYLTNKARDPGWENAEGMLLYPSNGYELDESFTLHERHSVSVATVDLAKHWSQIEERLLSVLS